ncbi:hypothetical protein PR048_012721, partial [Dryococelus australis]
MPASHTATHIRHTCFFFNPPKRLAVLEEKVAHRIPRASKKKVTRENKLYVKQWVQHFLKDNELHFWLSFFYRIMPHVDIQFQQAQSCQTDSLSIKNGMECFVQAVQSVRDCIETIYSDLKVDQMTKCTKGCRREELSTAAKEVCRIMITHTRDRFETSEHYNAAKLIDGGKFAAYSSRFPDKLLDISATTYPVLNKERLKIKFSVLYERQNFQQIHSTLQLSKFIMNKTIKDTFQE